MEDLFNMIHDMTGISRYSKSEVVTPKWVVSDMVDLLPADVFEPNSKFLDPAVKSGRFLAELYNRLMTSDAMKQAFPNEHDRNEHILNNQLYGIAMSETAAIIARKQLYDDFTIVGNIIYTEGRFTKELVQGAFDIMRFDVVIGNPPYNNDMYLDFVTLGCQLSTKYTVMIIPAKWQAKTDGKPKDSKTDDKNETFRKNIVPCMSKVIFYKDTKDVFDIGEPGGISVVLVDKQLHQLKMVKSKCVRNKTLESGWEEHDETALTLLPRKVLNVIGKVGQLGDGFKQSLYVKNTDHGETSIDGQLGFKRFAYTSETERGEALRKAGYVEVMQGDKVVGYKSIDDLFTTANLDKWKCIQSCMPVQGSSDPFSRDTGKALGSNLIMIIKPYQVPKGSFQILKYFDSKSSAESFRSYINSKTMSFMQFFGLCGATMTKEFFRFIPDPKDWSCIYVDAPHAGVMPNSQGKYEYGGKTYCSLYVKYGLTPDEIKIIESVIKERK